MAASLGLPASSIEVLTNTLNANATGTKYIFNIVHIVHTMYVLLYEET